MSSPIPVTLRPTTETVKGERVPDDLRAFPRIHGIRWDKPSRDADRVETPEQMLAN